MFIEMFMHLCLQKSILYYNFVLFLNLVKSFTTVVKYKSDDREGNGPVKGGVEEFPLYPPPPP